jgi:hypothetical protein
VFDDCDAAAISRVNQQADVPVPPIDTSSGSSRAPSPSPVRPNFAAGLACNPDAAIQRKDLLINRNGQAQNILQDEEKKAIAS